MPLPITLDSLIHAVEDSAPGDVLGQLAHASATAGELGDLGDSLLGVFVDRCRRDGRSWSEIGSSLGVSKQAVQQRFVDREGAGAATAIMALSRFTDRAQRVLDHANDEARRAGHSYRGTEHLLAGLFDEPDSVAAVVLGEIGMGAEGVRESIAQIPRATSVPDGDLPFTPRATRALELTMAEALKLGHNYVGTEHMLLSLLREREGLAGVILRSAGVEYDVVLARVKELLSGR